MPAESESQRRLMAIALGIKRGEIPRSYSKKAAELADSMTTEELEDFASKSMTKSLGEFERFLVKNSES